MATLKVHGGGGTQVLEALGEDAGAAATLLHSYILGAAPRARLTEEERLEREVARRRELDLERRARIFDAKRRTIGVDKEALDAQVAERAQRRELEKQQRQMRDADMMLVDRQLKQAEAEKMRLRREFERECRDFSMKHLSKECSNTYDLNDRAALRKSQPARVGDDDPRCGPSSMQKFNGEDLFHMERVRQQQRQMTNFIEQQKFEKAILAQASHKDDMRHAQEVNEIIAMRNESEASELALRKELQRSQQEANVAALAEAARKKAEQQREQMELNARELEFHASDPFLNEATEGRDLFGRPRKAEFKGSTRQERVQARTVLEDQANEIQAARFEEFLEDRKHAAFMEASRRQLVLAEREKQRNRRAASEKVARENYHVLRAEQLERTRQRDQLFTNQIGEEFHAQFGTSCR